MIAVVIAITLPALSGARESAKRIECLNNLRQLGVGVTMYMDTESREILPEVLPIIQPGAEALNDVTLLDVMERYIDAPRPRRADPADPTSSFIVENPYRCPSDLYSDDDAIGGRATHEAYGTSYAYLPGAVFLVLETFFARQPPLAPTLTPVWRQMTDKNNEPPLLFDFDAWHPATGRSGKNGLYISDGHADWIPVGDPDEAATELIEATMQALGSP